MGAIAVVQYGGGNVLGLFKIVCCWYLVLGMKKILLLVIENYLGFWIGGMWEYPVGR